MPTIAHPTSGIPDSNEIPAEPALVLPQVEPTRRRRYGTQETSPNGLLRAVMILILQFSSQVSIPSRDYLMWMFSVFGPLESSATRVSEEFSCAMVAFVCIDDAVEAVKRLKKVNPFGETLVRFGLQPKVISALGNIPPVISDYCATSVDSMKQNLLRMTEMLDKSRDRVSRETKEKLKSEIAALLEKVCSMPSSSSSSSWTIVRYINGNFSRISNILFGCNFLDHVL